MNQSLAPQESPLSNDSWDNVLALLQRNGHTLGPILLDGGGRYKLVKLDGTLRRLPQVLWIALPYMAPPMPASTDPCRTRPERPPRAGDPEICF